MTTVDTGELVLTRFVRANWRRFDRDLEEEAFTLEESLRRQFGMLKVPISAMVREVEHVSLRPGVAEFVRYCRSSRIPFVIVSGGLDFLIRYLLKKNGLNKMKLVAPRARQTKRGITLRFPPRDNSRSLDFKSTLVEQYHAGGREVWYVGDGLSDFEASKRADVRFVIKDSELSRIYHASRLNAQPLKDFRTLRALIQKRRLSSG